MPTDPKKPATPPAIQIIPDGKSTAPLRPARPSGHDPDLNPRFRKQDAADSLTGCSSTYDSYGPAYEALLAGNEAFLAAAVANPLSPQALDVAAMAKAQLPYTVVVCCSDSRMAPEAIYNQTLGNLFVIRNAGNIIDSVAIASIEYAVLNFDVQCVLILGHENCGAVTAAAQAWADNTAPANICGSLDSIISQIIATTLTPNATTLSTLQSNPKDTGALRMACMFNAQAQAYALMNGSSITNNGTQIMWAFANLSTSVSGQVLGVLNGVVGNNYYGPSQTRTS